LKVDIIVTGPTLSAIIFASTTVAARVVTFEQTIKVKLIDGVLHRRVFKRLKLPRNQVPVANWISHEVELNLDGARVNRLKSTFDMNRACGVIDYTNIGLGELFICEYSASGLLVKNTCVGPGDLDKTLNWNWVHSVHNKLEVSIFAILF
jgi:hypothetical protein